MNLSPKLADRQFPMTETAWHRLCTSAAAFHIKVWREGEQMFIQRPGENPDEFKCSTLHSAGFISCQLPSLGKPCKADASYRLLGRRLACEHCGRVSVRLPLPVLNQFENWTRS